MYITNYLKNFTYEKIECPLCKNNDCETMHKKGMFDIPVNLSICKKCGFVYLNPRWREKYYYFFYKKLYDLYFVRTTNCKSERTRYSEIFNRIRKITSFTKNKEINILDIGAGMGSGLLFLGSKYNNSNLFAIESSKKGLHNFKKNNIKKISANVDSDWEKIKYKFDLIVMRHVLEHLLHPQKTLSKIHRALSDNGYFYIAIPNFNCSESIITRNFFRVVHTLYFSKKNLSFILKNNGFRIIKIINKTDGEIYAICKKTKINKKEPTFNDYSLSKNKLLTLWKKWE